MCRLLILAAAMALVPALAQADDVLLKGGGKISGRILSRTDSAVQVDVGAGIVTVRMDSVLSIEEKRSPLDDYEERTAKLGANDVAGWLDLARWSSSQALGTQARRAYERVLTIDPQNVEANQALGRVLVDGRWVTELEVHRARGLVDFEGAWMTPAERDAILARRDAQFNDLLRLDAERRARDADMRAAEAEARAQQAAFDAASSAVGIPLWWSAGYVAQGHSRYRDHGRPSYGGKPWRSSSSNSWPPLGIYPSYPIGISPSYPIGPAGSFPIGPAGSFPVGPAPPHPEGRAGKPPGASRPHDAHPGATRSGSPARPPGRSSPRR